MRIAVSLLALATAGLVLASCRDDGVSPKSHVEERVAMVSSRGFFQDAPAGSTLPQQLTAIAVDSANSPVAGARVTWRVESADGGTLSEVQEVTGSDGTATARWQLGAAPGRYLVEATVGRYSTEFIGIATGPAARLDLYYPSTISTPGAGFYLAVQVYDARDGVISHGHVSYSSSDTSVVSIDSLGVTRSKALGQAVLTARVGPAMASVTIYVAPPLHATAVSVGPRQGCALTGDGAAYCWQQDGAAVPLAGGHHFTSLSEGGNVACGLDATGEVYCWGSDEHGQLGSGGGPSSEVPVHVTGGLRFASISAGSEHACGVTTVGAAYCWGNGAGGRLGTGSTADAPAPVPVAGGLAFREVSASRAFSCGLTTAGAAYCWGRQYKGELGQGAPAPGAAAADSTLVPAAVVGGQPYASLTTGDFTACGLTAAGALQCWGVTTFGWYGLQLASSPAPLALASGTAFTSVQAGANGLCGSAAGGVLLCLGDNYYGQLGDSTTQYTNVPVRAGGHRSFASFATGANTSCGIEGDGVVSCWGGRPLGNPLEITLCTAGHDQPLVYCRLRPLPVLIDPTPTGALHRQSNAIRQ